MKATKNITVWYNHKTDRWLVSNDGRTLYGGKGMAEALKAIDKTVEWYHKPVKWYNWKY